MSRFVRPDLSDCTYHGVESIEAIAEELGVEVSSILKVNANENAYGVPEICAEAIRESLWRDTHIYPDPAQGELRDAIAGLHGLTSDWVVAGAGSDDLLDVIIRATAPSLVVMSPPTFGMYPFLAKVNGSVPLESVPRTASFDVDVDALIDRVTARLAETDGGHAVIFLPSPNNPTGNLVSLEDTRRMLGALENGLLVIDEAYIDFAGPGTSADVLLQEHDNLVVCRTFSKWAGLAGCRVGYALASPGLVATMMAIKQPYNVNSAANAAALAALVHRDTILASSVAAMVSTRDTLYAHLVRYAPRLVPCRSRANFVLIRVNEAEAGISAPELARALRTRGVIVRYFGSQGGALESYIRISACRTDEEPRVFAALDDILGVDTCSSPSPLPPIQPAGAVTALLFDMDGVLADVGGSYRECIVQAAAAFGVAVTHADIDAAKAAGDANNDWKVTHALVSAAMDTPPSFEAVRDAFEALYHGTAEAPGLYSTERLLISKARLEALKARGLRLAVVTGRPRAPDATRFLADHDLEGVFECMVCMEDAPPKPSPEPLRIALSKLGVAPGQAAMLGDTVDDMRAAVAAGVRGWGVLPPGASAESLGALLRGAGAEGVFGVAMDGLEGVCL